MNEKKILIVDDDAVIVRTLTRKLQAEGYAVVAAMDGSEAVSAARQEKPDLILLDVTFPPDVGSVPWDGFRIMDWLHHMHECANVPVIIITGGDPAKYKERGAAAGAVGIFQKPIDHAELVRVVRDILNQNTTAASAPA